MVNLDLVHKAIQKASLPTEEEELASKILFDQIVTCMDKENLGEALPLMESFFAKDIPDFRIIVYYFYAYFFEKGILSFPDILPGLMTIINQHGEVLRPISKKDKQIQNSLNWLVLQVISKLKYGEKLHKSGKRDPIWEKSAVIISSNDLHQVLARTTEFKNFFYDKWPNSPTNERVMHLVKMIDDIKTYLAVKAPPAEVKTASKEEIVKIAPPEPSEPIKEDIAKPSFSPPERDDPLNEISSKVRLFELLIKKKDFVKAALVAKDLNHLIENFDPRVYFPKLFANYYALVAKNIADISAEWENKESLKLQYLEKLYKSDPDMFLDW